MARVCFLTERLLRGWGVDHVVHRVAEGLGNAGFSVDVVCLRADRSYRSPAYRVRMLDVPLSPPESLEDRIAARSGLLRQRPYDLYVACMFPFFGVASRLGLPFVYYEHGVVPAEHPDERQRRLLERLRSEAPAHQANARRIVAISRFIMAEQVDPSRHGDTDVVYNGADSFGSPAGEQERAALRARLGFAPDDEVVGYVGRVERETYKGVDDLVEIVAAVRRRRPRARLLLVGVADAVARRHFAELPFVTIASDVPDAEMPAYFAAMDVVASASRWEGFNLPLAEAQLHGRPVVAYRLAAHPEVVGPSGALAGTASEFADALVDLLADADARRRRGDEARIWAARFTWAATVAGMAASLRAAGAEPPAAP